LCRPMVVDMADRSVAAWFYSIASLCFAERSSIIEGMKSLPMSVGKKFLWASLVVIVGCAQAPSTSTVVSTSGETSLSDDQKKIEEMRKGIPPEKRKQNDELKAVLELFGEVRQPPEQIRDKYQRIMQRAQDEFRHRTQKEREEFDRNERKTRDKFMADLKSEREEFDRKKHDSEKRKSFYDDQDSRRRSFNATERDKRDDFNTRARQVSDDFRSDAHEKELEFTSQYRAYTQRYNDWKKALVEKQQYSEKQHPEKQRSSQVPPGTTPSEAAFPAFAEPQAAPVPPPSGDAASVNSMFNGERDQKKDK